VLVTVLDADGRQRADGVSGSNGMVTLRLPEAGTWTVSLRRIGLRPRQVPGVVVSATGTTPLTVSLSSVRQALPAVTVRTDAACGRAPVGEDRAARLWEQISLALRASTIAARDRVNLPTMRVVERFNVFTPNLEQTSSKVTNIYVGTGRVASAAPADMLANEGYVRKDTDESLQFFAPDEQVLLSESFVQTHCFTTPKRDADPRLAELQFKPVRGRKVPDITGTAYVDISTGELQRIDYRYVVSRRLVPVDAEHAGGTVHFRRLPNTGSWYVSAWSIRMPVVGLRELGNDYAVMQYQEVAGVVQQQPSAP
jgi:hypothetical protein